MAIPLTVDKLGHSTILRKLAASEHRGASALYARLTGAWGTRPDRERATIALTAEEHGVVRSLKLPTGLYDPNGVLKSGWVVRYRHPRKPDLEVVVFTKDKPPKRRTFKTKGGNHKLVAVEVHRITSSHKEAGPAMARTKTRSKKAVEEDELDELDALEDLDELDEDDEEEPEDEVEEDEDEEEAPPAKAKRSRAKAAKAAPKRSRKKAVVEDDEDEDEEDEEDEEPAPKKRGRAKSSTAKSKAKSSTAKSGTKKRQAPPRQELPAGRLGPQDIAEEADCDDRYVRVFLRAHADELGLEKPEGSFRWSFNKKEAAKLVKAIKRARARDDE